MTLQILSGYRLVLSGNLFLDFLDHFKKDKDKDKDLEQICDDIIDFLKDLCQEIPGLEYNISDDQQDRMIDIGFCVGKFNTQGTHEGSHVSYEDAARGLILSKDSPFLNKLKSTFLWSYVNNKDGPQLLSQMISNDPD
jgi:hypothetical protein